MPHLPSSGSVSSLSLGIPVIFSLALGRLAAFATGGLLKVVSLRATAVAKYVCLTVTLSIG